MKRLRIFLIIGVGAVLLALITYRLLLPAYSESRSNSQPFIIDWFNQPAARPSITNARVQCAGAPFILPSAGLIGLLWDDPAAPYTVFNTHTGLDIFGDGAPGTVPVYAAYEGYLTRLSDWLSTVIIRHDDPLQAGRTIWTYYTHMASRDGSRSYVADDFPQGTQDVWVEQGTLLGYQGEYGGSGVPIGLHVHFSIVLSDDSGVFLNESRVANTLDPSPYFGMALRSSDLPPRPIACG